MTTFDRLVLAALALLAAAATVLVLLGDRVGVRVVEVWPPADAAQVSTRVRPRVLFDQPMVPPARAAAPARVTPDTPVEMIWSTRAVTLRPLRPLQPAVTYTVEVDAGLASAQNRLLLRALRWQFTTAAPAVVYLAPDAAGRDQLFSAGLTGGAPQQLTEQPEGVWDYHVADDAAAIVYSAPRDRHGNDLFTVGRDGRGARLLDCGSDDCL